MEANIMTTQTKRIIKVRSTDCNQSIPLEVLSETDSRIVTKQMVSIHLVGNTVTHRMQKIVHWSKKTGKVTPAVKHGSTIYRIVEGLEAK